MKCNKCEERKLESGINNPFEYWLSYRPKKYLRGKMWKFLGLPHMGYGENFMLAEGHLDALILRKNGSTEYRDLGFNTITDAGVAYMASDFNGGTTDITNFTRHAWGTGACTTPPAVGSTALVTESPDESRVVGTPSNPAANQYRNVGTITAAAAHTIKEWGLFSQTAVGGTAWSLRCFAASSIGLSIGDSIQFTYTLTISSVAA